MTAKRGRFSPSPFPYVPYLDNLFVNRYNIPNLIRGHPQGGQRGAEEGGGGLATLPKGEMPYVDHFDDTYWEGYFPNEVEERQPPPGTVTVVYLVR